MGSVLRKNIMEKKSYLLHVAGLRGLAILLVVWFHFTMHNRVIPECLTLPMGYYGVDVFLVIMGYFLIEGFCRKRELTVLGFVQSKFRRILVPLAITVVITIFTCSTVLDSYEFRAICKTGCAALAGVSNYELMKSSVGYFADTTAMNPLMHTWYLSVSLQAFFLSYVLYVLVRRTRKACIVSWVAFLSALSFAYAVVGAPSYYETLPRLWEISAGGVVFLLPDVKNTKIASLLTGVGLMMILGPAFSHATPPSYISVLVVAGTILVIRYGASMLQFPIGCLLKNKLFLFLGKVSFSLYLIHLPILVLFKGMLYDDLDLLSALGVMMLCVALSYLFYVGVEKRKITMLRSIFYEVGCILLCVFCFFYDVRRVSSSALERQYRDWRVCKSLLLRNGLNVSILKPHIGWYVLSVGTGIMKTLDPPLLHLGDVEQEPHFVLIGDSHAEASWMGLDMICREEKLSGVFLTSIMIPLWNRAVYGGNAYSYDRVKAEAFMQWMQVQPQIKTVVIDQLWQRLNRESKDWNGKHLEPDFDSNAAAFKEFCLRLRSIGKEIVVIGPLPMFATNRIAGYARSLKRNMEHTDIVCTHEQFEKMCGPFMRYVNELQEEGVCKVVYPHRVFQTKSGYSAILSGIPMFKDRDHLSVHGSLLQMQVLKEEMCEVLKPVTNRGTEKRLK